MDDIMSATRYALMMKREAKTEVECKGNPWGPSAGFGLPQNGSGFGRPGYSDVGY
jgi:hypothetical protein